MLHVRGGDICGETLIWGAIFRFFYLHYLFKFCVALEAYRYYWIVYIGFVRLQYTYLL